MSLAKTTDIFNRMAKGQGSIMGFRSHNMGAITGGAAASGFWTAHLMFNNLGTTAPGTLVGFQLPPALPNELFLAMAHFNSQNGRGCWLARFYNMGTVDLTATGDKFTADASVTYPLLRTRVGASSQAIALHPVAYVTTATTTTPAVFRLRTAAGGTGYVDESGNNVVGTKTMTMPAAATAVESTYFIRLEEGDAGVRSIAAIEVTTAASAGALRIFGIELLAPLSDNASGINYAKDAIFGGLAMTDLAPATPTAGTLTSYLGIVGLGNTAASGQPAIQVLAVLNA